MNEPLKRIAAAAGLATACLLGLAGCGGGGSPGSTDDGLTPQQRDDRAASASVAGLMSFALGQIAAGSESGEPRSIDGITPPASEADDAVPL